MNPGKMILPAQSTTSALGKRCFISAALPTATIFSPSVTTEPFQITRLLGPRVATIPFSNLVVISNPFTLAVVWLVFDQEGKLFGVAHPHRDRSGETLLRTDRAPDTQGRIRVRPTLLIQMDRKIGTASAVPTAAAKIVVEAGNLFDWRKRHEICDRMGLADSDQFFHAMDTTLLHQESGSRLKLADDAISVFRGNRAE